MHSGSRQEHNPWQTRCPPEKRLQPSLTASNQNKPAMQLDIFEHSRDVMLRNAAIEALEAGDLGRSQRAVADLAAEYPIDAQLPALRILLQRLALPVKAPLDAVSAAELLRATEAAAAAARNVFGATASIWLSPLWSELATAIAHLPFDPERELLHAAPLLLFAGDWQAAVERVEAIPSWRRQPAPLEWRAEAVGRTSGFAEVWPLLAELAWMAAYRGSALARRLPIPQLGQLAKRFDAEFEGDGDAQDFAWFPAWVLVAEPVWADSLRLAQPGADTGAERGARILLNLLALERQGRQAELVEHRKRLRHLQPFLFELYMRSR